MFDLLAANFSSVLMQALTGRLFSPKQIESLSKSIVGKVFSDWLPASEDKRKISDRVDDARVHIERASEIVAGLRGELDHQVLKLEVLANEVEERKARVEEYRALLQADEPAVRAMRAQLQETVRAELQAQSERGRRLRQVLGGVAWFVTLILGSAVGAHWSELEEALKRYFW